MCERADPEEKGFKDRWFGFVKNKYKANLIRRYSFCNAYIKDKVVLDIPCGMGWGTSILKGYKKAYGIDINEEAVERARRRYKGITFLQGSLEEFSSRIENTLDVIHNPALQSLYVQG